MVRERPKVSAKKWAETPDGGFTPTCVKLSGDVQFFAPKKAGVYRIEIIPYEVPEKATGGPNPNALPGELHYERTYFTHRAIGVDENTYVCPAKTAGKPCPICEHRKDLMRDKDADEDLIKELAPKQRQLWNIFDHADADKGVQIWDISYHLFGKQLKKEVNNADEDDGYEYFADPEDGMTLRVGMGEESIGKGKPFLSTGTVGFKKRSAPLAKEILDAAQPLDNLLIVLDYEKLKSIFLQEEGVDHEGDGEDDEPKKQKPAKEEKKEGENPTEKGASTADSVESTHAPAKAPSKEKATTAADVGIGKGDDVTFEGKSWTVLKIAEDGTTVTLMDEDDEVKKGVEVASLKIKKEEKETKPVKEAKKEAKKEEPVKEAKKEAKKEDDWDDDWDK